MTIGSEMTAMKMTIWNSVPRERSTKPRGVTPFRARADADSDMRELGGARSGWAAIAGADLVIHDAQPMRRRPTGQDSQDSSSHRWKSARRRPSEPELCLQPK